MPPRDSASTSDSAQGAAVSVLIPAVIAENSHNAAVPAVDRTFESKTSGAVDAQPDLLLPQRGSETSASSNRDDPSLQQRVDDSRCPALSSSSLSALSPSSPEAPPLLPWPTQVMVGSQGEGAACGAAGSCCGPFTVEEETPVSVVTPHSQGPASITAMVRRAAVTISALASRDAVLLPRITVCILRPDENPNAGVSEEYSLRVSGNGVHITCDSKAGLAWALSTLQQLLQDYSKMCVVLITDKPRLGHRGVLLDVARNFVPVSDINLLLNTMSAVKLNVLHLHLTDDQVDSTSLPLIALLTIIHTTPGIFFCQCVLPRVCVIRPSDSEQAVFSRRFTVNRCNCRRPRHQNHP
jgi:hypothetical protein